MNTLSYLGESVTTVSALVAEPGNEAYMARTWRRFVRENQAFADVILNYAANSYGQDSEQYQTFMDSCVAKIAIAQTAADMHALSEELRQPA